MMNKIIQQRKLENLKIKQGPNLKRVEQNVLDREMSLLKGRETLFKVFERGIT